MKKFMCFGGGAGDGHEETASAASPAVEEAPRRGHQRRVSLALASSLFRRKFLSRRGKGKKKMKKFMSVSEERTREADYTDSVYGGAPSTASSSSAPLSLLSSAASSSASSLSSRSSSSSSLLRALIPYSRRSTPPTTTKRASPAAGAAVVALCLLMLIVLCCGRLGATLLTSTALYLLPRPARKKAVSSASERGRGTETGVEEGG